MRKPGILLPLLTASLLHAEVHYLTLRQAMDLVLKQNPDILMARLDEMKAIQGVRVAKDPFTPRITVGSGLAYSSGFPMSIEGSAPSVVQAYAKQYIFNRPQNYAVAQAKEQARGAGIATAERRDEAAFRAASVFLDAERAARISELARKQADSLDKVAQSVKSQVDEGRVLPIEGKRAALNLARARQTVASLEADQEFAESSLATVLGFSAEDRARPVTENRKPPEMPTSEEAAIENAIESSKQLRRLESTIVAKELAIRGDRAARLPRVDLVAQYGLFAKFNHYEDYFRTFQRNNGQLGLSFQLPLLPGPGIDALTQQSNAEVAHLRLEMTGARNNIIVTTRQAYRDIGKAESAREVARLDLDVAREQVNIELALLQEGRASMSQVEEARAVEDSKWIALYDAGYMLEKARWSLAHQTGDLLAALQDK
jgi:outer membrane protein TolC